MLTDRPEFFTFFVNSDTRAAQIYLYTIARRNTSSRRKTSQSYGRYFQFQLQVRSRYGADNVQKLVVLTAGRIDLDAVNASGQSRSEGLLGETPL